MYLATVTNQPAHVGRQASKKQKKIERYIVDCSSYANETYTLDCSPLELCAVDDEMYNVDCSCLLGTKGTHWTVACKDENVHSGL